MRFWDTSAIVPLVVEEPMTGRMKELLRDDGDMVVWWGTRIELTSALARRRRESPELREAWHRAHRAMGLLSDAWAEVLPHESVRRTAERLLMVHPLRTLDALQLAAALIWRGDEPTRRPPEIVCLDVRLSRAAEDEGFRVRA